jgi:hypothetical protein
MWRVLRIDFWHYTLGGGAGSQKSGRQIKDGIELCALCFVLGRLGYSFVWVGRTVQLPAQEQSTKNYKAQFLECKAQFLQGPIHFPIPSDFECNLAFRVRQIKMSHCFRHT